MSTPTVNDPLRLQRVVDELASLEDAVKSGRASMVEALTSSGWKTSNAVDYYAEAIVRNETYIELYRIAEEGGATPQAWAKALGKGMQFAANGHGRSSNALQNAFTQIRSEAARRWVRSNCRVWAELSQELLAWAPFEI